MYICGKNVAREYLESNEVIKKAYLAKNYNDNEILKKLTKRTNNIEYVEKRELDRITKENHQGIILCVPDFKYSDFQEKFQILFQFFFLLQVYVKI